MAFQIPGATFFSDTRSEMFQNSHIWSPEVPTWDRSRLDRDRRPGGLDICVDGKDSSSVAGGWRWRVWVCVGGRLAGGLGWADWVAWSHGGMVTGQLVSNSEQHVLPHFLKRFRFS